MLDIHDVHIVFELKPSESGQEEFDCNYYLIKHETRTVFWLDKFDASGLSIWSEVSGVKSATHVRKSRSPLKTILSCNRYCSLFPDHLIEASYWYVISTYWAYRLDTMSCAGIIAPCFRLVFKRKPRLLTNWGAFCFMPLLVKILQAITMWSWTEFSRPSIFRYHDIGYINSAI